MSNLTRLMTLGFLLSALLLLSACPSVICREDIVNCRGKCSAGHNRTCTDLGSIYEDGRGAKQSYEVAAKLYTKSCKGGCLLGCTYLGNLFEQGKGVKKSTARAAELYRKGCKDGILLACLGVERLENP